MQEKQLADVQTQIARSRALAAEASFSLSQEQLDLALLLSLKAYKTYPTYEARNSLLNALEHSSQIVSMLRSENHDLLRTLAFSSNSQVFVASDSHRVYMWNTAMRQAPLYQLDSAGYIGGVALSQDNHTVVIASAAGVWLWNIQTGRELAQLDGSIPNPPVGYEPRVAVTFSLDGEFVEAARCNQYQAYQAGYLCVSTQVTTWNVFSKQRSGSPSLIQANADSATFSSDGQLLATSTTLGIQVWSVATGKPLPSPFAGVNDAVTNIVFSPDNKLVAASGSDKASIYLWNVATGNLLGPPLVGHTDLITDLAFSPNGHKLASSSIDKTVRVWDITQGKSILTLTGDAQIKRSLTFSPNGTSLLSGSNDGTILLWNISAENTISRQLATTPVLRSPVFSPNGALIYAGSADGTVMLYNTETGQSSGSFDISSYPIIQPKIQVQTDLRPIESLALTGDGSLLAAGRADGTIVLWDTRTGKSVAHFIQQDLLYQLLLSSNGQFLASAGTGNNVTITLWDVAKRKLLHAFPYTEKQPLGTNPPFDSDPSVDISPLEPLI